MSFEAYGQYKHTKNFIEDIPSVYPTTGPYKAANLVNARRQYKAVTLDMNKRYADNWTANVSYTYSRLEGNFDTDYASGGTFNTSSFLQDGPGWFVEDPNRYGLLSQDRPHVFKAFGSYDIKGITVGGFFRYQSGVAWEARGADSQSSTFNRYLEKAGTRRVNSWTNVDLLASYRLDLGMVGIKLEGRLLNVFNTQTALTVDKVQTPILARATTSTPPPLRHAPADAESQQQLRQRIQLLVAAPPPGLRGRRLLDPPLIGCPAGGASAPPVSFLPKARVQRSRSGYRSLSTQEK
jgi:hypothetical protein